MAGCRNKRRGHTMIDAKSLMEFFEKEFSVQFIDMETNKRALDIIAEKEKKNVPYSDPAYNSDYDIFLESEDDEDG